MKWQPGTGLSAQHFIVSDDLRWSICKTGEPPVYSLARLGGKVAELVMCGTLIECKQRAEDERSTQAA